MPTPIEFHFDFISPYGWFASRRIEAIAARHGREVDWHPMLLGVSVMKVMGLKPLLDTPLKGDYVRRDVMRYVRRHGLSMKRDIDAPSMNPLAAGRAFCWVKKHHPRQQAAMAHAIYEAYWAEGMDLSTPEAVASRIVLPEGIEARALLDALNGDEPAALLRASVEASLAKGVFGSPTVIADGEMFWGVDRLAELDEWLAEGGW